MAIKKQEPTMVTALQHANITLRLIGTTPFYYNSMSVKAKRDLLIGSAPKTTAEKREIKHNPEEEFRDSVYKKSHGKTHLYFPPAAIKQAMATAAIETKGVAKTNVQRLIFLPELETEIYGRPYLKIDTVRMANINKTPDMRTRAYLPRWCAEVDIAYVQPTLSAYSIVSLLTNAGSIVGIGDFRQEKGRGSFGTFQVLTEDSMGSFQEEWDELMLEGRDVQQEALDNPEYADDQTAELMAFMEEERMRRDVTLVAAEE